MSKLCQIVAVTKGVKSRTQAAVSKIYKTLQQNDLFTGMEKSYSPCDDAGPVYPSESKKLQAYASDLLVEAAKEWSKLFDVVATQDHGNCIALANVVVGNETVLEDVPVPTLLFLEKQLIDVRTFLDKLPVLDPAKSWRSDEIMDCYVTDPVQRTKTKKVKKFVTMYEATKEHPAQIDTDFEDIVEGFWNQIDYSGAMSESRKGELLQRVNLLIDAVKKAREEANSTTVKDVRVGSDIFEWLLV